MDQNHFNDEIFFFLVLFLEHQLLLLHCVRSGPVCCDVLNPCSFPVIGRKSPKTIGVLRPYSCAEK
jgi:hypothetical protein